MITNDLAENLKGFTRIEAQQLREYFSFMENHISEHVSNAIVIRTLKEIDPYELLWDGTRTDGWLLPSPPRIASGSVRAILGQDSIWRRRDPLTDGNRSRSPYRPRMARALYYLAAITAFVLTAQALLAAIVYVATERDQSLALDLLAFFNPLLLLITGGLFYRKHRHQPDLDGSFDKPAVVSVGGIGCLVAGLVWLASEIHFAASVVRMNNEVNIDVIERVLAPVVLASLGAFFAFAYPRHSAGGPGPG